MGRVSNLLGHTFCFDTLLPKLRLLMNLRLGNRTRRRQKLRVVEKDSLSFSLSLSLLLGSGHSTKDSLEHVRQ